ncbi:MAG: hypothetical protein AABX70_08400 [Nanoarchaeota archaeon]
MGQVVRLDEARQKRLVEKFMGQIGAQFEHSGAVAEEFSCLARDNPEQAVDQLGSFIARARDHGPDSAFGEAVGGGPCEYDTAPFLDIIGELYPILEKPVRVKAFKKALSFLDGLNYFNSQNNVELINEPWLVGDILVNRMLYWPGYQLYVELLAKCPTWNDLVPHIGKVCSDFFLTTAVMGPKYASLDVRHGYYEHRADILDRTLDATAARILVGSHMLHKKEGVDIEGHVRERLVKYDPLLHSRIREKMQEKPGILLEETVSKADYVSEARGGSHWGTFGLVAYFKGLGFELF